MHELSLCQNILDQLADLARRHDAAAVSRVEVEVGELSGVEPQLLAHAFLFAREGTLAADAILTTISIPPRVACFACGGESEASANDLRCAACGSEETSLIGGKDLILARVEMVPAGMAEGAFAEELGAR